MAAILAPAIRALEGSVMRPAREALVDWARESAGNQTRRSAKAETLCTASNSQGIDQYAHETRCLLRILLISRGSRPHKGGFTGTSSWLRSHTTGIGPLADALGSVAPASYRTATVRKRLRRSRYLLDQMRAR